MRYRVLNTGPAVFLIGAFLLTMTSSAALSQDPVLKTRPKEDRDARLNAMHRITINVQVADSAGNPVSDLRPDDFTLYDNQQTRRIAAFRAIDGRAQNDATQIVIVLDAVNTPADALDGEKNAIFNYLAESHKPMPFPTAFALWFNGHLSATPATTDRNAIGRAFVKLTKNVHSNSCDSGPVTASQKVSISRNATQVDAATCRAVHLRDSVAAVDNIAQQQLATGARTLLIWMGSGWPALSNAELQRLTVKQQHDSAREFATLLHDLRAAQVTVYSLRPGKQSKNEDKSVATARGQFPPLAVDELAVRTGGKAINATSELTADLHACIRDAQWYYTLSFNAPLAQNDGGEMHSLAVRVDRPGVEVRTMDIYYTEPR